MTIDSYIKVGGNSTAVLTIPERSNAPIAWTEDDIIGFVKRLKDRHIASVDASNTVITDRCLPAIINLGIAEIDVSSTSVTDEGIDYILKSESILVLKAVDCPLLRGDAFRSPTGSRSLKELHVSNLPGDAVVSIVNNTPSIRCLIAERCLADSDLMKIDRVEQLQALGVPYSKVTDAGLNRIAQFSSLELLDIHGNPLITDYGLNSIATGACRGLRRIEVDQPEQDRSVFESANSISFGVANELGFV